MRLIDADALKRYEQKIATEAWKMKVKASVESTLNQFIDHIDHAPTVDAVQVVRCRDCKRYQHEVGDDEYALGWCPFITIHLVSRNGFCAWGKRKEDGNADD